MPGTVVDPITAGLESVLDQVREDRAGNVADYIPELAAADPAPLGIALMSGDGHLYCAGDAGYEFTIQSISKPLVFALAIADRGVESVYSRVGVEPSGKAFNALSFDHRTGRPPNPMINAGALVTTSLVLGDSQEERFARILDFVSVFAGRELSVNDAVYRSEQKTASRNRGLAHLMKSEGGVLGDVDETVDLYCRQCAIEVTPSDLATMAATLATGGISPITGKQVVSREVATGVLSVMATCGMYDYSGEWLLRVGMPAKSGVSGGLFAVRPGQFGIGAFSPRLDRLGNSVRGGAALRRLSDRFNLHLMVHPDRGAPVLYGQSEEQTTGGRTVAIVSVQGTLDFAAAERLLWVLDDLTKTGDSPAWLVLDMHRVTHHFDVAEALIGSQIERLRRLGIDTVLVHEGDPLPDFLIEQQPSVEQALSMIAAKSP